MEQSHPETLTVRIQTNEEPPREVIDATTGAAPTVEFTPGNRETREHAINALAHRVLGRFMKVDKYEGKQEDGTLAYRTRAINPDEFELGEEYRLG